MSRLLKEVRVHANDACIQMLQNEFGLAVINYVQANQFQSYNDIKVYREKVHGMLSVIAILEPGLYEPFKQYYDDTLRANHI